MSDEKEGLDVAKYTLENVIKWLSEKQKLWVRKEIDDKEFSYEVSNQLDLLLSVLDDIKNVTDEEKKI